MRIGLFTDTYRPQINGVATSVCMLQEHLTLLGNEVFVFTTTDPLARQAENNVYRMSSVPAVAGRRLASIPPGIMKTITELNLDLIHTHTEFSLGLLGRMAARRNHLPLIHTMHTIYESYTHYIPGAGQLETVKKDVVKRLCVIYCNSVDRLIVPTRKVGDLLSSYGVVRDMSVIATGIDVDKFREGLVSADRVMSLRRNLGIRDDDRVLISIGRISKEKNIDELLHAMRTYLPPRPNVRLLIVGDGPAKKELERMSFDFGIAGQVIFVGEQPWDDIPVFYKAGQVFICASQSEAQGLTFIEALASGLPVVAKADRCLDGTLYDGVNGYVFNDSGTMTQALDKLLLDEPRRQEMSVQAVDSAQRFSGEHFAQAVQSLYVDTLKAGTGSARGLKAG
jgi:1,2-diacylglycerol 3-alpha-glucosyltransferase